MELTIVGSITLGPGGLERLVWPIRTQVLYVNEDYIHLCRTDLFIDFDLRHKVNLS